MRLDYGKIVDEIRSLPIEEKHEIRALVEKYIIEERREEISENFRLLFRIKNEMRVY
jgi:adenylate kinase